MSFVYEYLPSNNLTALTTDKGRVYSTPIGNLTSVTTVLDKAFGKDKLQAWRDWVGEEQANQIGEQARNRGTAIHKVFEDYLRGEVDWKKDVMSINLGSFLRIKPFLDKNLTVVYGIEHKLYSKELKSAGTADLIARWNHKWMSITDFKTSKRLLKEGDDRLLKYRLQATTYAIMVEELYDLVVPYNVIIVLVDGERSPQIDITTNDRYRKQTREIFYEQGI